MRLLTEQFYDEAKGIITGLYSAPENKMSYFDALYQIAIGLQAENTRLRAERDAAVSQIKKSCKNCLNEDFCREDESLLYGEGCGKWEWRGTERGAGE